jgi:hypothetical protein
VIASHAAFELAAQVQSRFVLIASEPDMPSAGAAAVAAFSRATWHLSVVGPVTEMDDDVPVHPVERSNSDQIANSRARKACIHGASVLPSRGPTSSA